MPYVLDLPTALRRRGLKVETVPGWETRGSASFNPYGSVSHWTAGPRTGDRPSLRVCTYGRPGLSGPLCNVFLTRSGVAVVVAAGRANHAGRGGIGGLRGNSSVFGTEAENSGSDEWTPEQRWAYPRVNAAYIDLGASPEHIYGHSEWAPDRKVDIQTYTMDRMRQEVRALLANSPEENTLSVPVVKQALTEFFLEVVSREDKDERGRSNAFINALNAAAPALADDISLKTWTTPVIRTDGQVSALQELADAKTHAIALRAEVAALTKVVESLAAREGVDLTEVEDVMRRVIADAVVQVDVNVNSPKAE